MENLHSSFTNFFLISFHFPFSFSGNSISTSVRANSDISTHSNYQSLSEGVSSVGISSGVGLSNSGHSIVSQGRVSPSIHASVQLQNVKMTGYGFPVTCCDQTFPVSQQPTPMTHTPSQLHKSEAYRLQEQYDKGLGKRIDTLSVLKGTSDESVIPEDSQVTVPNQVSLEDYNPPSDPRKLAMLTGYDAQNLTPSSEDTAFTTYEVNEEKMRMLTELSDEVQLKSPCPVAMPFSAHTDSNCDCSTEIPDSNNCQLFVQSNTSPKTWDGSENGSSMKRSSDIDNNAVETVAGHFEAVNKGEAVEGQNCDKNVPTIGTQNVSDNSTDVQGSMQRRCNFFSLYKKQVEPGEG